VQTLGTRVNGCGVHDVVESPLKYVNPSAFDLHLQTSSLALGLVPLSLCASSDIDGNPRPLVASATTCDAGADEQ